ncbi:WD-40 repeat protein, putative [Eimeria acervulina]|uniref:WD-40 repeat protein, putative n=1 Tax=Eimeria acervulina TaxID=5801 RepID=U6GFB4_EIMAC|nr:WD-40 repeat protein, putative [Eimeria acervulina]CDI77254.1 WD-40 repeat protein, putative [Eimeria acervulina]
MSRTKTEPTSPPMVVDAYGASEGTAVSAASGTSRQRALSIKKACLGSISCGQPRQAKIEAAKHEAAKHRQGKQAGVSGAAAGSGPLQPLSRRRSRGSSVTFAVDDSAPCMAASTASRASSPTNDSSRCKKVSTGPKSSQLPAGTSMSKEEWPALPTVTAPHSSSGTPTTSLRITKVLNLAMRTPESSPSLPEFLMKARATGIMLGGRVVGSFQYSLTATCVGRLLHASLNGSSSASQFACYWPLVFYRARVYHGNDTLIASKANDGCVYLFDSCKFGPALCLSDAESEDSQITLQRSQMATDAELILTGHTTQGWGLEWSPTREGWLASSGDDGLVCIWDTRASSVKDKCLSPVHRLVASSNRRALQRRIDEHFRVQDVAWKCGDDAGEVIVAVGDDGELNMWDLRAGTVPVHRQPCNHSCANVLALNPLAPNVFATGGADAVRTTDRFVRIFDCSLIGAEQSPEEAEEGAPEVIFVHGGHVAGITEIDWNPLGDRFPWVIASASEDNVLQIWQPSVKAFEAEEADFMCDEGSMDEELLD